MTFPIPDFVKKIFNTAVGCELPAVLALYAFNNYGAARMSRQNLYYGRMASSLAVFADLVGHSVFNSVDRITLCLTALPLLYTGWQAYSDRSENSMPVKELVEKYLPEAAKYSFVAALLSEGAQLAQQRFAG